MKQQDDRPIFRDDLSRYLESHGYTIKNPEILNDGKFNKTYPDSFIEITIKGVSKYETEQDNDNRLPEMYDELVEFVKQVPRIQSIQLKPLLFAFFYHTVLALSTRKQYTTALEYLDRHTKNVEPENAFHSFHESDIKKLQQLLMASTLTKTNTNMRTTFHTSLTETTYQALVAFLMDKSFTRFLNILHRYVRVTLVPLNYFTNRVDIPSFIYHSTDQTEEPTQAFTSLLADNPFDMAKKYLGDKCNFEILDDDDSRVPNPFPLPKVIHSRVEAIACDLQNMMPLSKTSLPSIAYFTFSRQNISYDINYNGTLIAASTEYGYTQLFSTSIITDLDDNLHFLKDNKNRQVRESDECLVPRHIENRLSRSTPRYCTRTLIGPRTYCCRFSPDSRLLICAGSSIIRIWQCEYAGGFSQISIPCGIIWCTDWSPFGYHFVTGSDDKYAWLWSVDNQIPIRMFTGHQEALTAIRYHPNAATIATASYDRSVMLWDIRESSKNPCTRVFAESNDAPMAVQFARNGRVIISGDEMGKITTWDIGEGRKFGSVKGHKCEIRDMTVSIEGTLLASSTAAGEVAIWDTATLCSNSAGSAKPLKKFMPRNSATNRVSFSSRNLLHAIGSLRPPQKTEK